MTKNYDEILRELSRSEEKENNKWDVYGVNKYSPSVKVADWWYGREGLPKDYDAFCPTGDVYRSSYNRLGTWNEDDWTTETFRAMETGLGNKALAELTKKFQRHSILTFLSYPRTQKVRKDLLSDEIRMILPALPRDLMKMRYSTTYNSSYKWMQMPGNKCFEISNPNYSGNAENSTTE